MARLYIHLAPPTFLQEVVGPLLRLLGTSREVERAMLANLHFIAEFHPVSTTRSQMPCIADAATGIALITLHQLHVHYRGSPDMQAAETMHITSSCHF